MKTPMKLSMLKTLFLGILLLIASTLLIANAALSSPSPQQILFIAQTPVTQVQIGDAQTEEPANPQESESTETGKAATKNTSKDSGTVNRQRASEESPSEATPESDRSQSAGPYDMEAVKAFNRALYGS